MPAPSPMTKPSRSRSNGRLAFSGVSLRVERARMAAKAVTPTLQTGASLPPANITSASPRLMISKASPMPLVLAAQAVQTVDERPFGAERERDLGGRHVGDHHGDEQRAHAVVALGPERVKLVFEGAQAADAGGHDGADALGFLAHVDARRRRGP